VKLFEKAATTNWNSCYASPDIAPYVYATAWVAAVDAHGTSPEKLRAHHWLGAYEGAAAAKAGAVGGSSYDRWFAIGNFYRQQGPEFKALAKRCLQLAGRDPSDDPMPTTAEVLAGAAADITGAVAQGSAQRAAINQQAAQMKAQQAEAQRRQQEQVADAQRRSQEQVQQQETADQRIAQQEAASQRQQQQLNAAAAEAPVANYQQQCIRAEVSRERQCASGNNITLRVVSVCPASMNARFCVQRADGTWQCGQVDGVSTGPIASTNALQYVCDGTGQTKVWMRTPLQGGWVPWPEP
jgi:hypothetical protein